MTGPDGVGEAQLHAIDSNSLVDLDVIITKKLGKIRQFFFGPTKKDITVKHINSETQYYNCRLRYIRLHWKKIIEILLNKQNS